MTQTALTIVGYGIGFYFGGPVGGSIGAAIGGGIGGYLAAPDVTGPRLTDTQIQQSSYGANISKTWGGDRVSGAIIWAGPMVEHENEESGKGGPTSTTFSYSRSFAILIGEGPVTAIRRVWADTKLILDFSDLADHATQMASAATARYFVFYPGDESQMPDPTIEAIEGVGLVEPYRGRAYVVFTDWPLGDYGNRIPQFSFEISNNPPATDESIGREPLVVYPWVLLGQFPSHSIGDTAWGNHVPAGGSTTYANFGDAVDATVAAGVASGDFWAPSSAYSDAYVDIYTDSVNPIYNREGGANAVSDDAQYVWLRIAAEPPGSFRIELPDPSVGDDWLVLGEQVKTWVNYGVLHTGEVIAYRHPPYSVFGDAPPPISPAYQTTYAAGPLGGGMSFLVRGNPVLQVQGERVPTHRPKTCFPGDPCTALEGMAELPGDPDWCIACDGEISPNYGWTIVSGTAKQLAGIEYRAGQLYQNGHGPVLLPADPHYSDAAWWAARKAEAVAAGTVHADVASPVTVSSWAEREPVPMSEVAPGSSDLAVIVRELCLSTGLLLEEEIDVIDLEHHEVLGFSRARRGPARAFIDELRRAYFFDAAEDGDRIRFVMRGAQPDRLLTLDDLGAGVEDAEQDPVESERGQEEELPARVDVAYKARSADYQTGTQTAKRRAGNSTEIQQEEFAIVLDDDHAARIAEIRLYLAWIERNRRRAKTWMGHADLQPTDVLTLDDGELQYTVRLEETSEQDGVIDLNAVDDDPDAYVSSAVGALPAGGGAAIRVPGPTRFELLDIPLLRAEDDGPEMYVAARGYRADWRGGRLLRSTDGGATFSPWQDLQRVAVIGHATTVLGDWPGGNVVDEINSFDVVLIGGGTLSSITNAALLSNGNPMLLGREVLQAQSCVLVADRTYRCSRLLRGRLGTERFQGTHAADDRFVLLSAALYRPGFEFANVGVELDYKAISFGDLNPGAAVGFTNTAQALRPLAPVHLNVAPRADGGWLVSWVRRTRFPAPWIDGTDAPLGESSESYLVRVLDGAEEVSSQTVSAPEALIGVSEGAGAELAIDVTYLGEGFEMAVVDSDGDIAGVGRNPGASLYHYTARLWDGATGAILEESSDLGEVIQATHGAGSLYAVGALYSGAVYSAVNLYRFDYGDLATPAATRACTDPAVLGFQGVAHDGTDAWVVAQDVQELQRCDEATLARVNGYSYAPDQAFRVWAAAGWIWLPFITVGNVRLQRVDPSDGSFVDSLAGVAASGGVYALSPSRVFIVDGARVQQFDATASPPALLSSFTRASPALSLIGGAIVGTRLFVGEFGVGVTAGVHAFDMATGAYLGNTVEWRAASPAGARGAQLLASGGSNQTWAFDIGAIASTDLEGMTVEVAQISEAIGPGQPATATIPGGSS